LNRGDLVTVSVSGDHGKPRPAVVIQADRTRTTASVLVCLCTSRIDQAAEYRLAISPSPRNGLQKSSLIQGEKIHAVARAKCGPVIGSLTSAELSDLDICLSLILGMTD
jgi:mRNA interferase MazF